MELRIIHGGDEQRYPEREFLIDNLLVRIHSIIVMIRWTGLASWEFESLFAGGLTSSFLEKSRSILHSGPKQTSINRPSRPGRRRESRNRRGRGNRPRSRALLLAPSSLAPPKTPAIRWGQPLQVNCRGTSLVRNSPTPLGPQQGLTHSPTAWVLGGGCFLWARYPCTPPDEKYSDRFTIRESPCRLNIQDSSP